MYPKKLPEHNIRTFHLDEITPDNEILRQAYFHVKDYPINMHSHDFYEINIVVEGRGVHYIEDQLCETRSGDVFAIPPKIKHGYWSEDSLNLFHLLIPNELLEKHAEQLSLFPGYYTFFEIEPWLRQEYEEKIFLRLQPHQLMSLRSEMENLIQNFQERPQGYLVIHEYRTMLFICTLCQLISRQHLQSRDRTDYSDSLEVAKTIEYMRRNFSEKILVEDLCRMASMSRSTYLRRFKAMFKTTPSEYLMEIRTREACDFLKDPDRSITDISQSCGFFDCSHFIRYFRRFQGVSPKEYRNRLGRPDGQ